MKDGHSCVRGGTVTALPRTIETRNEHITQFVRDNQNDLKRFMTFKTGILDDNIVRDCLQDFFYRVTKSDVLNTFDPALGRFDTFICSCFANIMTTAGKKNERVRRKHYSLVPAKEGPVDIFSRVGGEVRVLPTYVTSQLREQEDTDIQRDIDSFLIYIRKQVPPKEFSQINVYLTERYAGCMDRDIASMLKFTNQKFRALKKRVQGMFKAYCKGVLLEEYEAEAELG